MTIEEKTIRAFRRTVYAYYDTYGRHDLPWRRTADPYRILVSEVMLQQTQVPRVIAKYRSFVRRWPSARRLAAAPLAEVLREWQGLGYNRRARFLRELARTVTRDRSGRVPLDIDALRTLPGVGDYTAKAVAVFAGDRPYALIETNIRTVFIHHFFPGRTAVRDEELMPLIEAALDRAHPRRWYSALFDYGTFLKQETGNASRRAAAYVKAPAFKGSDRQARGRILAHVLAQGTGTVRSLAAALALAPARLTPILDGLVHDGILMRTQRSYRIRE